MNPTAGTGQHSHEVPLEIGRVVHVTDGNSNFDLYRVDDESWRFVDIAYGDTYAYKRVLLVRLTSVTTDEMDLAIEECDGACAYDLSSPDGLAFIGIHDKEPWTLGEVLWDSASG